MARLSTSRAVVLAALMPAALAVSAETKDLRVSRVVLFSSGVGHFERAASVTDNAVIELRFRTAQVNDILKSLIVQDLDGGSIGSVGYASKDPIEKTLKSFAVDLTKQPSLGQLLSQLRGEPIEIVAPRALKGTIIGIENRRIQIDDKNTVMEDFLNILTDTGIEHLQLSEVQGLRLSNEKVDAELRKALATLASGHDADRKTVVIAFHGKGQRRVRASYLLESPVWKTSYRLALSPEGKPFLQGWAIVENTTEEDWSDVRLSLVSGRPISFAMDMYTPLYVPRPMEQMELFASLRPPEMEAAAGEVAMPQLAMGIQPPAPPAAAPAPSAGDGREMAKAKRPARVGGRTAGGMGGAGSAEGEGVRRAFWMLDQEGVASVAEAKSAGELFEYAIQGPVSVARQRSAMLPIVNENVEGEKISVFNPATHPKHPLNALQLTNSTKLHLMQGPVTLFDGDVYAGDAKLPDLQPGEKRLVGYALDLAMEVTPQQQSQPDALVSLRIAKGTLIHRHKYADERIYVVKNKDGKDHALLIEQPYGNDWTLVEPKEPHERTANLLRFKVAAPAAKSVSLKVRLERVADETIAVSELGLDGIALYVRTKVISPAVKEALEKFAAMRTEMDRIARERAGKEKEFKESTDEQERVRKNLGALDRSSDSYRRQMKSFDELESQIQKHREEIASLRKTEEQKRNELQANLMSLDVE